MLVTSYVLQFSVSSALLVHPPSTPPHSYCMQPIFLLSVGPAHSFSYYLVCLSDREVAQDQEAVAQLMGTAAMTS